MILCCGEALIDMIPSQTIDGKQGFVAYSGGAIFNTARALGRLGASVGIFTGLSRDQFGEQLADALAESNVDTLHVAFSGRPTTLAFVHLVEGQARYSFFDENSANRMLALSDLPTAPLAAEALFFGGISLVAEPAADTYAELAAREAGSKLIMIDPNVRPSFIQDEGAYRTRLKAMLTHADIVKISDEDLDWFVQGSETPESKVAQLLSLGSKLVLLTKGGDGAAAFSATHHNVSVPALSVDVVDTVGAGDAFNAGVLAKLQSMGLMSKAHISALSETELVECLSFAVRVAGHTVARAGAEPPLQSELEF